MILDLDYAEDGTAFEADICIVGGGAAGITLALGLMGSDRRVLLLESGGERVEEDVQSLSEGEVVDPALHSLPAKYRQRRLGGSTGIWGGRCLPFDAIDFERRPWIEDSGWPFGLDELLPYYAEANGICEAGRFAYTAEEAFAPGGARPIIGRFRGRQFTQNTLERFSLPTDFGRRYRSRLHASRALSVLLHANATELRTDATTGGVAEVAIRTLRGKRYSARAKCFVLAIGGIETPRLLLASMDHHAEGIGNANGWVGRTYMCHIAGTLGEIRLGGADRVWHGYEVSDEGVYCRRRFALTAAAQRSLEIGNFTARLHHPRIPDPAHRTGALSALYLAKPLISYEYSKRLHGEGAASTGAWPQHVRNIVLDPFATVGFLAHLARKRILARRKFPSIVVRPKTGVYSIEFNAEQEPNRNSRIRLVPGSGPDRLGMPRVCVDWRYTGGDMRTVREAVSALADDLETSGCGRLEHDPEAVEAHALRDGALGGHHIGTARMAESPLRGVVDADCRVHGVPNLYVAGSAVFPTSSQANPTLTICAMALRLAEHLQRRAA